MTLSDPNPGFKVTVYLQVDYLNSGATLLNSTTHTITDHQGLYRKRAKNWGSSRKSFSPEGWKFSYLRYGSGRIAGGVHSPDGTSGILPYSGYV